MVVSGDPSDEIYLSDDSLSGVVKLVSSSQESALVGTGTLLWNGRAVLTAAHVVSGHPSGIDISLNTVGGKKVLRSESWLVHPDYDAVNVNQDLALIWLNESAPAEIERYELYRETNEIGQKFTLAGSGMIGSGDTGATEENTATLILKATNTFDLTGESLDQDNHVSLTWAPRDVLFADFDSGLTRNDVFGRLINIKDLGTGQTEGFIAPGDSGGPAFIGNQLAGIASYVATLSKPFVYPDYDMTENNSTFGEVAAWQRISSYQQWIDQSIRDHYFNAPKSIDEVKISIFEGSKATTLTYFMVTFSGFREAGDIVSVDYTTRDGSAKAGEDYLAVSGQLNIYDDEDYALIPVEIIGDQVAEKNETFYLVISNPVGGDFANDSVELIAMRTILNDDSAVVI